MGANISIGVSYHGLGVKLLVAYSVFACKYNALMGLWGFSNASSARCTADFGGADFVRVHYDFYARVR
jgi:hypothetical protein